MKQRLYTYKKKTLARLAGVYFCASLPFALLLIGGVWMSLRNPVYLVLYIPLLLLAVLLLALIFRPFLKKRTYRLSKQLGKLPREDRAELERERNPAIILTREKTDI